MQLDNFISFLSNFTLLQIHRGTSSSLYGSNIPIGQQMQSEPVRPDNLLTVFDIRTLVVLHQGGGHNSFTMNYRVNALVYLAVTAQRINRGQREREQRRENDGGEI